ncbi:hypothetical protein CRM22_011078, partial [Opisthorchis felineus]
ACPSTFLPQYYIHEKMGYKPTWGETICALRLMLQEMINLDVISQPVALDVCPDGLFDRIMEYNLDESV